MEKSAVALSPHPHKLVERQQRLREILLCRMPHLSLLRHGSDASDQQKKVGCLPKPKTKAAPLGGGLICCQLISGYAGEGDPSRESGSAAGVGLEHLLSAAAAAVAGRSQDGAHRGQFLAFDQHLHFFSIDCFALQQGRGDAMHCVLVRFQNAVRRLVGLVDQAAYFKIDLAGCLFREVPMLGDFAAEEDLLFLLAEGQRTEPAHAVLADHAAGEVGGVLNIAARAGGHLVEEDLLSHAAAVGDRQIGFKILAGVVVPIAGKEDRDAQSHATRNDRDLVDGIGMRVHRTKPARDRPRDKR